MKSMKFDPSKSVKPWIESLPEYVPGKTIEGYIKLASNENNYGPSPRVFQALKLIKDINVYPHKEEQVKEAIAEYCGAKKENILLGNGSDELLEVLFKTFKGPTHSFNPTYSEYRIFTQALGGTYRETDLDHGFQFSGERFLRGAREADANLYILCSPNNPTGMTIGEKDLKCVLDEGKITVVDEAYVEFSDGSFTKLVDDYPNLIVMRTFSKAFALAGLRVGYLIASPEMIPLLRKVRAPFSVNSIALELVSAALKDVEYMNKTVRLIINDRQEMTSRINERYTAYESSSNYILFDTTPAKSEDVYERFMKNKIILRRFGKFPRFEGDYLRVSVGTQGETKRFLEVLDLI